MSKKKELESLVAARRALMEVNLRETFSSGTQQPLTSLLLFMNICSTIAKRGWMLMPQEPIAITTWDLVLDVHSTGRARG